MTGPTRSRSAQTAVIAVAAFVVLGMPKAAFSVAWPSVAGALHRDIADLGMIVAIFVAGYLIGTLSVGRMIGRFGTGAVLTAAACAMTAAIGGYAVAGTWAVLLLSAIALGISGGLLDVGLNAHVAVHRGTGAMGWLHAGFGIGSAAGPLLITGLLAIDAGWRIGFWVIAALQIAIAVMLGATRRDWDGPAGRSAPGRVRRRPVVVLTLLVFLLYVGLEVAAAQWGFTFLTEGRSLSEGVAGLAVTGFWIALTGARVLLGIAGDRTPQAGVAAAGTIAAVVFTSLLWWSPAPWVGPAALVALGASLGPIFPLQTLLTPIRVGAAATTTMVGYQMAAASVGAILIPGGLGPLVSAFGVEIVAPVLVVAAAGLVVAVEAARRWVDR
ncbi:MAG: MFS transporter [Actinobacteria bacterium]|nr:MFS transporter [Actinomycetota bacterium]